MASGDRSLRLTDRVRWEDFPKYARAVVRLLGGSIENRADGPTERVWAVTIRGASFWIAFDDFGLGVSLDARDANASALVVGIQDDLRAYRSDQDAAG